MGDHADHPSRKAWEEMEPAPKTDTPTGMHQHTYQLPRWVVRCVLALVVVGVLNAVGLGFSLLYDVQQQQFIEGRGEQRDRENERLNQRINDAICDLLDQLPEGGLLERPREKYGCGPGIPLEELPEDIRQRYFERDEPQSVMPPARTEPPPLGSPAQPNPYRPTETYRNPPN